MSGLNYLFLFIFGTAIGSFLNVMSLRYNPEWGLLKNIFGRSHCDHCGKTLHWYELVPLLSFLLQLGKCRACKVRLSLQYPIVELICGLVFVLVPSSFLFYPSLIFTPKPLLGGVNELLIMQAVWLSVFVVLTLISVIDFRLQIIPDSLTVLLTILGFTALVTRFSFNDFGFVNGTTYGSFLGSYALMFRFIDNLWITFLGGGLLAVLFFGGLYFLTRGYGIGFGDVKLAFPLGLLLGYPDIVLAGILSFIIGAVFGIFFIFTKRKGLKDHVPFAPFMVMGVTLVFFFGYHIIDAYFRFFKF